MEPKDWAALALDTVQTLNRLWTREGRVEELAHYFHPRMVAIVPTARERIVGGAACVSGWKSFCEMAEILSWREIDPQVEVFAQGLLAVVSYDYEMDCVIHGQRLALSGRDLFTLVYEDGRYQVVSDQFSSHP